MEQYRAIASANGARTHAALTTQGEVEAGFAGRQQAVMAALVENVQRRKTRRGKDFVMADFSDQSGQFSASCFEEGLVEAFQRWAADGTCVLLTVELDSPSADEPPRVTVRGARPLAEVTSAMRMRLEFDIDRPEAVQQLALILDEGEKRRGEVIANVLVGEGRRQKLRLGWDFHVDGDLAEKVESIDGVSNVRLGPQPPGGHLRVAA